MNRKENFIGVFGHVNLDYIMDAREEPKANSSTQATNVRRYFGGTGSNIAMLASGMGVKSALASFVGRDFPDDFRRALSKVDTADLVRMDDYGTPTCWVLNIKDKGQACIIDQGPMADLPRFPVAMHTIESSEIVHVGTGHPGYYRKVMAAARKLGKRIHFDPGQELRYMYKAKDFAGLLAMSDLLFVNEDELRIAMNYLGIGKQEEMLDRVGILVVTRGKRGSEIHTPSGLIKINPMKVQKVVDATGAGDAYRAGFYAGLSRGLDLEACGILGSAASSIIVGVRGPVGRLPTWDEVWKRAGL